MNLSEEAGQNPVALQLSSTAPALSHADCKPYLNQHRDKQSKREVRKRSVAEVRSLNDQCLFYVDSYFRFAQEKPDPKLQYQKLTELVKSWKKWVRKNSSIYNYAACKDLFFNRMFDLLGLNSFLNTGNNTVEQLKEAGEIEPVNPAL